MSWCDVAWGPCWCPSRVRCNTAPERFVLRLVQVSDLERVAQFWDTGGGCIEQVVCFRGDTDRLNRMLRISVKGTGVMELTQVWTAEVLFARKQRLKCPGFRRLRVNP